ncbi:MAG TPA: hypothetical protein VMW38_06170 [Terriglobia bacterium]|nr:hypothetical protein [Terriglobia bacterium]
MKRLGLMLTFTLWSMDIHSASLTLKFHDALGNPLTLPQVQTVMKGNALRASDAWVTSKSLKMVEWNPIESAGSLTIPIPPGNPAFAITWPTATHGYSYWIMDNLGKGFSAMESVVISLQLAQDCKRHLDQALATPMRADYVHSPAFDTYYDRATAHIATANGSSEDSVKGREGLAAMDDFQMAFEILLREHGPKYASANKANCYPQIGVTFEDIKNYQAEIDNLWDQAGDYGVIRFVFSNHKKPSYWTDAVNYAHKKGLKILGQPIDSSADARLSKAQYINLFKSFVNAFAAQVDYWEVGNEVSGEWLSQDIDQRIAECASWAKHSKGVTTELCVFWQISTYNYRAAPGHDLFTWISNKLPKAVRDDMDIVTLSVYPEMAPLGGYALDWVMRRLREEFPTQRLALGELGYWIKGQRHYWNYNQDDPLGSAKHKVAETYYNAIFDFSNSVGFAGWWCYSRSSSGYDWDPTMDALIRNLKLSLDAQPVPGTGTSPFTTPSK